MLVEIFLLLVVAFFAFHRWRRGYWRRKGVYSIDGSYIFGSTGKAFFTKNAMTYVSNFMADIYQKHKNKRMVGFYHFYEPALAIFDMDLTKHIFATDFTSFSKAGLEVAKDDKLFKYNAFVHSGEQWKTNRSIQLQMVSQGRLKEHFSTMTSTCQIMVKYLSENNSQPIKVSDVARYYTTDMVSSVIYGLEPSAFTNPENGFRKHVKNLFPDNFPLVWASSILMPSLNYLFNLKVFAQNVEDFFLDVASKTFEFRKKNKVSRNDLFDLLIKVNQKRISEGKEAMTADEVASHMMTLFADSVDTSGSLLSFILLELGNRPEVQEQVRADIMSVGKDIESFDYEKVHSIHVLDRIIKESLRLHPLLLVFTRVCTKNTRLEGVEIEEGTKLFFPFGIINNDPEFFPEPEKFNPDRFLPENEEQIKGKFLPFGEGPKQCLGMKYATLQIKLGIIAVLLNFKVTGVNPTKKVEVTQDEKIVFLKPDDKEVLMFEKI